MEKSLGTASFTEPPLTTPSLSYPSMLKILQARLQQYVNFQMFKLVLEKAEEPDECIGSAPLELCLLVSKASLL